MCTNLTITLHCWLDYGEGHQACEDTAPVISWSMAGDTEMPKNGRIWGRP